MALHSPAYLPYANFWESFTSLTNMMFGNFNSGVVRRGNESDVFSEDAEEFASDDWIYFTQLVLVFVFIFLTSIFLLQVLIAILSFEYERLDKGSRWLFERAMVIR